MSFARIEDQPVAVRLMRNVIRLNRIPNGLLFWGPGGVGKRLTAIEMAKAVNCGASQPDSCDECLSCRKVTNGNHPDVKSIAPTGKSRNIGVEAVDFMNDLAAYRPFESAWRIFIIMDADRMGVPAQNHFLKTLEEPPSNTLFILLTEWPRALLPTIRSRCQQVRFGALRPATVTKLLLRERDLDTVTAEAVSAVSQGQMSRALDLVDSEKRDIVLDVARRLGAGEDPLQLSEEFVRHLKTQRDAIVSAVKAEATGEDQDISKEDREEQDKAQVAFIESLIRRDLMEYLYLMNTWYRDQMVFQATGDLDRILNRDQTAGLRDAPHGGHDDRIGAIAKAWLYVERNLNMERVFRDLFFSLAP